MSTKVVRPSPSLLRPEAYLVQLARLQQKARTGARGGPPPSEGVGLEGLRVGARALCETLAGDVGSGRYQLAPLWQGEVKRDGKLRTIHRPELLDAIVLGAVAARLTGLLEGKLSDSVHAYRPRRSSECVLARFCERLAQHRQEVAQKRRGLFVLQRDVAAYGESIPTHAGSPLWTLLDDLLMRIEDARERRLLRGLIEQGSRPTVRTADGRERVMQTGLPTGSPIQQPLENLYLVPLDAELDPLDAFYARFGDDLFVATTDLGTAAAAVETLSAVTARLELRFNAHKSKDLYFTKPGRPFVGATPLPLSATSHVEYLGARIDFDGRLGFTRKRLRQFLERSRRRMQNSIRLHTSADARTLLATSLGQALTTQSSVEDPAREALCTWVDDRAQLRQLDRALALSAAEILSGKRGVRAFRHTPPRDLRAAGLASLLELRRRTRSRR